ncbi:MAG: hypothetical protein H0U90_11540 [Actinobacteria bacterium]|nr:hypothetical protein [Actinomycetota bacterium]
MASSKRQTTMAKLTRERKVQEKRELKREKKLAAAEAKAAAAAGELPESEEEIEVLPNEQGPDRPERSL